MHISPRRACLIGGLAALISLVSISATSMPLFENKETIPADAIVLFDGKDLSQWMNSNTLGRANWKVENGYCTPVGPDIDSRQEFTDCQLHLEFWLPYMPKAQGQNRANSGVFFNENAYEIQILDSYGQTPTQNNGCGAIYSQKAPLVNASRPPETWQTYDIIFHAPKFNEHKQKIANARVTVYWNGVLVQDNEEILRRTADPNDLEPHRPGPIRLQNHGTPVRFRNIWVRPLN